MWLETSERSARCGDLADQGRSETDEFPRTRPLSAAWRTDPDAVGYRALQCAATRCIYIHHPREHLLHEPVQSRRVRGPLPTEPEKHLQAGPDGLQCRSRHGAEFLRVSCLRVDRSHLVRK